MNKLISLIAIASVIASPMSASALSFESGSQTKTQYNYEKIAHLPSEALKYYQTIDTNLSSAPGINSREKIRARYYKEAEQLALSEKKESFIISPNERKNVTDGIISLQTEAANILSSSIRQIGSAINRDNVSQEGKTEFSLESPYGTLRMKYDPVSALISRIKGEMKTNITLTSDLALPNKNINEIFSIIGSSGALLPTDGITRVNTDLSGEVIIKGNYLYLTLKSYTLKSGDPRIDALSSFVTPHIGKTYRIDGGKELKQSISDMSLDTLIADSEKILAGLKTTPLLVPYRKLEDGSYALRMNGDGWKSLRKKVQTQELKSILPKNNNHNFNNLTYKNGVITMKLDRSSQMIGSIQVSKDANGRLLLSGNGKSNNKKNIASFTLNISSSAFLFSSKSNDMDIVFKSDYTNIYAKFIAYQSFSSRSETINGMTWTLTGKHLSNNGSQTIQMQLKNDEGVTIESHYALMDSNGTHDNKLGFDMHIPETVLQQYGSRVTSWGNTSFPKNISIKLTSEWREKIADIMITKPTSFIELN